MKIQTGKMYRYQQGLSLFTVAFLLAFMALILVILVKIFPAYARNMTIKNSIENTLASNDVRTMNISRFRSEAMKSIDQANGIRDFDSKAIVFVREGSNEYVDVNYEYRIDLLSNIDVILTFENRFDY